MSTKKLFIASTGQNVGKTTLSLGLFKLLQERFQGLGFMKPVGQEYVQIDKTQHVDKDVKLLHHCFHLMIPPHLMSPVLIPAGFTKEFLDGKIASSELKKRIETAFDAISKEAEAIIIEGTGHLGVGSIIDLNNAQVAAFLKAPIVLICPGGLGSSFDELSLNLALCEKYGAKIAGVIVNKVKVEKQEMIASYMQKALNKYNLPLLGTIPYDPLLSSPSLHDLEQLFEEELLTGKEFLYHHFETVRVITGLASSFDGFLNNSQLLITAASREDVLLAVLTKYWDKQMQHENHVDIALILTGEIPPKESLIDKLKTAGIPMLYVPKTTQSVIKAIHNLSAKIQEEDTAKIHEAMRIVKQSLAIDQLLKIMS